jgi:hypothetical protein
MTDAPTTSADVTDTIDTHLRAYCEPDPARRVAMLESVWTADGELIDPPFEGSGISGISAMVEVLLDHYPGHRFERTTTVDAHHSHARYGWSLVSPDGEHAVTGTDLVDLEPGGMIRRIVGFFGDQTLNGAD